MIVKACLISVLILINGSLQMGSEFFDDIDGNGEFGLRRIIYIFISYFNDTPGANVVTDITEVYAEATDKL